LCLCDAGVDDGVRRPRSPSRSATPSRLRGCAHDEELQLVGIGVEHRDGLFARAVEGAGVDDAGLADAFVALEVGVAVEEVIEGLAVEGAAHRAGVVAVLDVEEFAAEFEVAAGAEARDVEVAGVALEAVAVPVGVAEDEGGGETGEQVEDLIGADIAAVDEVFGTVLPQEFDPRAGGVDAVVRVAEDPDQHDGSLADDATNRQGRTQPGAADDRPPRAPESPPSYATSSSRVTGCRRGRR